MKHNESIRCSPLDLVLILEYILEGGVVGVGRGTKTDTDVEDVTTASEDAITAEEETMSEDVDIK